MTPKEKAKQLIIKYRLIEFDKTEDTRLMISILDAKQCALIAVDEIIKTSPLKMIDWGEIISDKPFWIEVKKEIENL